MVEVGATEDVADGPPRNMVANRASMNMPEFCMACLKPFTFESTFLSGIKAINSVICFTTALGKMVGFDNVGELNVSSFLNNIEGVVCRGRACRNNCCNKGLAVWRFCLSRNCSTT